jgi:protein SCO1/2
MTARTSRIVLVLSAFAAGLVVFFGIVLLMTGGGTSPAIRTAAAIGGPFQLIDQNGRPATDQDMKGRPFLVFFGFTNCPDVCPTTLFDVSEVMRTLGRDADRTGALFITVDPERDTPDKLKDYLASFDPRVIGITGDPAGIAAIEKTYRVYAKKVPLEGANYTMDHTAIVYLMDKEGRFVTPFNLKRRPEEAAADLKRYL